MTILHILADGPNELATTIMKEQSLEHEVKVFDMHEHPGRYDELLDEVFAADKVISWNG